MGQLSSASDAALQGLVEYLGRRDPHFLEQRRAERPDLAAVLTPGRLLGKADRGEPDAAELRLIAGRALGRGKVDGERCLAELRARARGLARLRFAANALTSLSSLGIIGLVLAKQSATASLATAVVGFAASLASLFIQYREEYLGGPNALPALRNQLVEGLVEISRLEGELRLLEYRAPASKIADVIGAANLAVSRIRRVELACG